MSDEPNHELLSAYLDGELSAGERAEVERLLAADPAVRRQFDELRELSEAVRSLPRQSLGGDFDMPGRVLREAARRKAAQPAVERSLRERILSRRAVAWASIAAAVGLAIFLHEQRQAALLPKVGVKEVALAQTRRSTKESEEMPAIRAAEESKSVVAGRPAEPADAFRRGGDKKDFRLRLDAEKDRGGSERVEEIEKMARPLVENVLVVRCDVRPEALRNQSFDKLLAMNNIVAVQRQMTPQQPPRAEGLLRDAPAGASKPLPAAAAPTPTTPPQIEQIVEIEATPAQIEATVAALEANPDEFPTVLVHPVEEFSSFEGEKEKRETSRVGIDSRLKSQMADANAAPLPRAAQLAENRRQLQRQFQFQQANQPTMQQRARFVLRVVDAGPPTAAPVMPTP